MKWLGGVMLVLLSLTGNAQKTVFQNLTWEQAAELAQKENKIILVDAMREPATPEARKQKDKEEAVWQKVAANLEFCKQHVVAIRIDMASEAGKEFAPKLVMNMYLKCAHLAHLVTQQKVSVNFLAYEVKRKLLLPFVSVFLVMFTTMPTAMGVLWVSIILMQSWQNVLKLARLMLLPLWKPAKMNV